MKGWRELLKNLNNENLKIVKMNGALIKLFISFTLLFALKVTSKRLTYKIVELLDNNEIMVGKDLQQEEEKP
jgi:hypothetical protein